MPPYRVFLVGLTFLWAPAYAQDWPSAQDLASATARRFPQPVRVGDLLGRKVVQHVESMSILGRVRAVVRRADGAIVVVMNSGGVLGFFSRSIGVPVNAMTLLGEDMEIIGFKPEQLAQFPAFDPIGTQPLKPENFIHVGLGKPAH